MKLGALANVIIELVDGQTIEIPAIHLRVVDISGMVSIPGKQEPHVNLSLEFEGPSELIFGTNEKLPDDDPLIDEKYKDVGLAW